MMRRSSLLRGTPTCASRLSCARSARAHSPGWTPRSLSTPPGSSSPRWTPSTISHFRRHGVTASGRVPHSRSSATMPDLAEVLAAHLAHLRLLGRSERTVYDRERAVVRLAAWLAGYAEGGRRPHSRCDGAAPPGYGPLVTSPGLPHRAVAVLAATPPDLAAWRAALTGGDPAAAGYWAARARFSGLTGRRGDPPPQP